MTEYNAGSLGMAKYWMERAQRAEAAISDALSIIEGAHNTTVYTTEGSPAIGRWVNGSDVGPILRKALASAPADGWKLVPIKSTPEMHRAADMTGDPWDVWDSMIAAAPSDGGSDE